MKQGGPKPLEDSEISELVGTLAVLAPKSPEFRQKRLELALKFKRTERSIEMYFAAALKKFAPGPSTAREPSDSATDAKNLSTGDAA